MFDSSGFPKPLEEEIFYSWLEKGRSSRLSFKFLLVVWNEFESEYQGVFAEDRDKIREYKAHGLTNGAESLIAVYDLYSESRISLN
jgi:hypothetical protein